MGKLGVFTQYRWNLTSRAGVDKSKDAQKGRPARPQASDQREPFRACSVTLSYDGPAEFPTARVQRGYSETARCASTGGIHRAIRPPAGGLFEHPAIAVHGRRRYHPVHATYLDADRPSRGTLPHWSHYHPAHTGCDGGRPNRMDALSPCISYSACGARTDRMDLDRHGLRHLWNSGISLRPCHSDEHLGRKRRTRCPVPLQCDERDRELFTDPVRWARVFAFIPGDRASRIPSSQSSVPFFIRKTLIRSNPASVNQALVSAAE